MCGLFGGRSRNEESATRSQVVHFFEMVCQRECLDFLAASEFMILTSGTGRSAYSTNDFAPDSPRLLLQDWQLVDGIIDVAVPLV